MNPEYCLANLPDENSANSQENVFNLFDLQHVLNNDNSDPDINSFINKFDVVDSPYFSLEEIPCKVENFLENSVSVFHVNIRSLKFFEKLLEFLSIVNNEFDVIAVSETWCSDDSINVNSLDIKYQIIFLSVKFEKLVMWVED